MTRKRTQTIQKTKLVEITQANCTLKSPNGTQHIDITSNRPSFQFPTRTFIRRLGTTNFERELPKRCSLLPKPRTSKSAYDEQCDRGVVIQRMGHQADRKDKHHSETGRQTCRVAQYRYDRYMGGKSRTCHSWSSTVSKVHCPRVLRIYFLR